MREISTENVVQAYLSGLLAYQGRSVAILSNNGTEFKNKVLNEACDQLELKGYPPTHFIQRNAKVENVHNFLK